jgi:hypothetical protein
VFPLPDGQTAAGAGTLVGLTEILHSPNWELADKSSSKYRKLAAKAGGEALRITGSVSAMLQVQGRIPAAIACISTSSMDIVISRSRKSSNLPNYIDSRMPERQGRSAAGFVPSRVYICPGKATDKKRKDLKYSRI